MPHSPLWTPPARCRRDLLRQGCNAAAWTLVGGLGLAAAPRLRAQSTATPAELTSSQRRQLQRLVDFVNGIDTLRARLIQESSEAPTREGTFYLDRPGRMRVEYDSAPLLLVANGRWLIHYDTELDSASYVPLEETLAGVLANGTLSLEGDVTITRFDSQGSLTLIRAVRTSNPQAGTLTLLFETEPTVLLRRWVIVDAQNSRTEVSLFQQEYGVSIPERLFEDPGGGRERF